MDGSTLDDALELSFNNIDTTSVSTTNNIDILSSLASTTSSSNMYTKQEIHYFNIACLSFFE